jgi:hypothetical protein
MTYGSEGRAGRPRARPLARHVRTIGGPLSLGPAMRALGLRRGICGNDVGDFRKPPGEEGGAGAQPSCTARAGRSRRSTGPPSGGTPRPDGQRGGPIEGSAWGRRPSCGGCDRTSRVDARGSPGGPPSIPQLTRQAGPQRPNLVNGLAGSRKAAYDRRGQSSVPDRSLGSAQSSRFRNRSDASPRIPSPYAKSTTACGQSVSRPTPLRKIPRMIVL